MMKLEEGDYGLEMLVPELIVDTLRNARVEKPIRSATQDGNS
jgi:hypothetical protein